MSEYRRFYSYIYNCEQGQKTANAGFAKIELRDAQGTIELHLHGVASESARLHLFVRKNDMILGFALGDVSFSNGTADRRFAFDGHTFADSGYTMADAVGIFFTGHSAICLMSQWDEVTTDWSDFMIYEKKEKQTPAAPAENAGEIHSAELAGAVQTTPVIAMVPHTDDADDLQKTTAPLSLWDTMKQLQDMFPHMQPFADPALQCLRIELKDLRLLPPSNWHLCNNGFLLHSFFAYRHLILGELSGAHGSKLFLGVPGIRYRQEHVLASMFGFLDFLPEKDSADAAAPFGYWYTFLTEPD